MDLLSKDQNKIEIHTQSLESFRPLLTTYAYNILGTVDEASDIVQDALLKFMRMDYSHVENIKAYLIRTVINLSINQKKRQKKVLTNYPGQWLPEPVSVDSADASINRKEILSYSLMVLLEKLNAKQRAVFILKEAFDYDHAEIGEVIGVTEEHSRQLLSRAKKQIKESSPSSKRNNNNQDIFRKYMDVIRLGDTSRLEAMLNQDIVFVADGGGKVSASRNPIHGKNDVGAMLLGLYKKFYSHLEVKEIEINHQPALVYYEGDNAVNCHILSIKDGLIDNIFVMRNPDKLKLLKKEF